jgi:hypothetical protein
VRERARKRLSCSSQSNDLDVDPSFIGIDFIFTLVLDMEQVFVGCER